MKKKTAKKIDVAKKFNKQYAKLEMMASSVMKKLLKNAPIAKKLSKLSIELAKYGDKNCYQTLHGNVVCPIKGIKDLNYKLDLLDQLARVYSDLEDLAEEFDLKV